MRLWGRLFVLLDENGKMGGNRVEEAEGDGRGVDGEGCRDLGTGELGGSL